MICFEMFGTFAFIYPEGEEVTMSYWPGDIGDESLVAADNYKKKCSRRVASVLDLVKVFRVDPLGWLCHSEVNSSFPIDP